MPKSMEMKMDFSRSIIEFEQELETVHENLVLFNEIQNTLKSSKNVLSTDVQRFNIVYGTVKNLGNILRKFNSDIDIVFANINGEDVAEDNFTCDEKLQNTVDNKCKITHIVDAKERLCYAIDMNGKHLGQLKQFWKYSSVQELETNESLGLNEIFGIKIDMNVHRGKFVFDKTKNTVRIRLIDTGEIVDAKEYDGFKKLPDDIKSIPACAFLCKIQQIGSDDVERLSESLKGQIFDYRIQKIDENNHIFYIEIFSTNPFLMGLMNDTNWTAFSEFGDETGDNDVGWNLEQTINETLQTKWNVTMENKLEKLPLPSPIYNSNYDLNDNASNGFQLVENRNAIASNACTLIDLNEAAALDTTNVDDDDVGGAYGYNSDEKSISIKNRLSDPPSKSWYLNANKRQINIMDDSSRAYCLNDGRQQQQQKQQYQRHRYNHQQHTNSTFESVRPMKTQCETYLFESHHNRLKTPSVGESTTIIPTCILNAGSMVQFYGQLGRHFSGWQYFQQRLNNRRSHFDYEPHSQMPGNTELVLVLLENGHFHRGKVLSSTDNQATVFLVDYGTTHMVSLHHIYKWTPNCDNVPFQAVLFTLSNVNIEYSLADANINNLIKAKIPKTFISAEITKIDDRSIYARLFDDSGYDIGEEINCIST